MTLQICVIVNVWKDQAQPIAAREEKSTANASQLHVTICSHLIPSAHARELRLLQDVFGVDASMHGVTVGQSHPHSYHSLLGLLQCGGRDLIYDALS